MHEQAHAWVRQWAPAYARTVLDIGGRNINGTVRDCFPAADYISLDILPGDGVDIVADAATWSPERDYDTVVCCEVFEHTPDWPQICKTAFVALAPAGRLILTMAGPGRPAHSAIDGGWSLHPGEHYGNVGPGELRAVLEDCGFADITVDYRPSPADTRAVATKPEKASGGIVGCGRTYLVGETRPE